MASASGQKSLPQVDMADAIAHSAAFTQAARSDTSTCCVRRFDGPFFLDLCGGAVRVPDAAYSGYLLCPSYEFCQSQAIVIPSGLLGGPFSKPKVPNFALPRLIPLVNPCDKRTFAHEYLQGKFPMVAVQLWKLIESGAAYRSAVSTGLNRMLGFDGKILLSSVMPDADIVKRGVGWFIKAVKELKPDVVTTWDVPTYFDHPKRASLNWLLAGLEASRRMSLELDVPLIGLVAGADLPQAQLSSSCLRSMGFEYQALACHELLVGRQQKFLRSCASVVAENCSDLTLLSCSHPNLFEKFRMADHFVGMSWFNQAVRGRRLHRSTSQPLGQGRNKTLQLIGENLKETTDALRKSFPDGTSGGSLRAGQR